MTTLCVTPLQQELDGLCQRFVALGYAVNPLPVGRIDAQHLPQLDLIVARGGH